ncbi:MAG: MBL fold metallo-hydrolase [Thermoguttaceae bacterium]
MAASKITITSILSVPFEENSYIAHIVGNNSCIIVDPGLQPQKIVDYLEQKRLMPAAILNTHGHADHIAGNDLLKQRWPDCPLVIGANEAAKLTDARKNLSLSFGVSLVSAPADVLLNDGETYTAASIRMNAREISGHSPGHLVYVLEECEPKMVFAGDVIFAGSVGRTDFPDGDFQQLLTGIREKLFSLSDDTILLPGHGPTTTVGDEKRGNPFVGLGR